MNEIANIDVKAMTVEQLGADIRLLTAQAKRTLLDTGIQIGYRLQLAKEKVEGESFTEWVERETEFSKSSAYRFIQLYEEYGAGQGSVFGVENIFPTLGKVSISNALRLLSVPEKEREEFAAEVDAEHISARELEEAIRARDEALLGKEKAEKALNEEREAGEGAAIRMSEAITERQQYAEKAAALAAKVKELESRPIEVAVQMDEEAVKRAAEEAKAEAEEKAKAERETLVKQLQEAQERARRAELDAEKAKDTTELDAARAEAETLKRKLAASDGTVAAMNAYIQAALISINKAGELLGTVENEETKEKLKGAMRKLAQMIEAVAA